VAVSAFGDALGSTLGCALAATLAAVVGCALGAALAVAATGGVAPVGASALQAKAARDSTNINTAAARRAGCMAASRSDRAPNTEVIGECDLAYQ
jgi:hypothetical protein